MKGRLALVAVALLMTSFGALAQTQVPSDVAVYPQLQDIMTIFPQQEPVADGHEQQAHPLWLGVAASMVGHAMSHTAMEVWRCTKACNKCENDPHDEQACTKCEECKDAWFGGLFGGEPAAIDPRQPYLLSPLTPEQSALLNRVVEEWGQTSGLSN